MHTGSSISEHWLVSRGHPYSGRPVCRWTFATGWTQSRSRCLCAVAHTPIRLGPCRSHLSCCCREDVSNWRHEMLQLSALSQRSTTPSGIRLNCKYYINCSGSQKITAIVGKKRSSFMFNTATIIIIIIIIIGLTRNTSWRYKHPFVAMWRHRSRDR